MSDVTETNDPERYEDRPRSGWTVFQRVRAKDHAVLECIRQGDDTVRAINKRTIDSFTQDNINYAFRKLEELDLIMVQRRKGWTTSILENGEPRRHRKSKQAALTERGMAYFDWKGREADLGMYDAETAADLRARVADLEAGQDALKQEIQKIKRVLRQYVDGINDRLPGRGSVDDD